LEKLRTNRFERLNATRMSVAGEGWTEPNNNFSPEWRKMQINLGGTSIKKSTAIAVLFCIYCIVPVCML
jgi:hypothetical protein